MDATPIESLDYLEYDGGRSQPVCRPVIAEMPWVLYLDRRELLTFMCTPTRLHCLALGFLLAEGLIGGLEDVWQLRVFLAEDRVYHYFPAAGLAGELRQRTCEEAVGSIDVRLCRPAPPRTERRILTSGCGGGLTFDDLSGERTPLTSSMRVSATALCAMMAHMHAGATLYRQSRGVHTSALYDSGGTQLVMAEDVGRHNTLDKLRGACLLDRIATAEHILITSGRISSEMIGKARAMETPIVVSRTSPTVTSVRLARRWNMTLVGYLRGRHMRIYADAGRIVLDGDEHDLPGDD